MMRERRILRAEEGPANCSLATVQSAPTPLDGGKFDVPTTMLVSTWELSRHD